MCDDLQDTIKKAQNTIEREKFNFVNLYQCNSVDAIESGWDKFVYSPFNVLNPIYTFIGYAYKDSVSISYTV